MRYKRFLSLLLTFSMCLQLLNTPAIAATLELDRALEGQAEVQGEDGLEVQPLDVAEDQGEDEPEGQGEAKGEDEQEGQDEAKGEDEPQAQPEGEPQTQPEGQEATKEPSGSTLTAQSEVQPLATYEGASSYEEAVQYANEHKNGAVAALIAYGVHTVPTPVIYYYPTLAAAFQAAGNPNFQFGVEATVLLLDEAMEQDEVVLTFMTEVMDVTFDVNDYGVTLQKGLTIDGKDEWDEYRSCSMNLTIKNTERSESNGGGSGSWGGPIRGQVTVTNGAYLEVTGGTVMSDDVAIEVGPNSSLKVTGGEVQGKTIGILDTGTDDKPSRIEVFGGKIHGDDRAITNLNLLHIEGGEVYGGGTAIYNNGRADIRGFCTIFSTGDTAILNNCGDAAIFGGTISCDGSNAKAIDNDEYSKIHIYGGTISSNDGGTAIYNQGELTLERGEGLNFSISAPFGTAIVNEGEHAVMQMDLPESEACPIVGEDGRAIVNNGGELSISGGYINAGRGTGITNVSGTTKLTHCYVKANEGTALISEGGTVSLDGDDSKDEQLLLLGDKALVNTGNQVITVTGSKTKIIGAMEANPADTTRIKIKGGMFQYDPSSFVAIGYLAKYEDGYYWVVRDAPEAEVDGVQYNTLAEAIEAAQSKQTVKLLKNVILEEGVIVPEDKEITLDLAGFDLSGNVQGALLTNEGTLTIEGHDELESPSHVYHQNGSDRQAHALWNTGALTINGGVYGDADDDETNANTVNGGGALYNTDGGTASLNGGRFTCADGISDLVIFNDTATLDVFSSKLHGKGIGALGNISDGSSQAIARITNVDGDSAWTFVGGDGDTKVNALILNMEGGTIETENLDIVDSGNFVKVFDLRISSQFTMTGGSLEHNGNGPLVVQEGQNANLQINDATLVGSTNATLFEQNGGNLGLSNVSLEQNGGGCVLHQNAGYAAIVGGSHSFTGEGVMISQGGGTLDVVDGAVVEHKGNGSVLEQSDGTATFKDSNITLAGEGVMIQQNGRVDVSDGAVIEHKGTGTVIAANGRVTFNDNSYTTLADDGVMIQQTGGTVNVVDGAVIEHKGNGTVLEQTGGETDFEGGSITFAGDGAFIQQKGDCLININGGSLTHSGSGPLIWQDEESLDAWVEIGGGTFEVVGGGEGVLILQEGTNPVVYIKDGAFEVVGDDSMAVVKQVVGVAELYITGGIFRGFSPFVSGTPVNVQIIGGKYHVDDDEAKEISDLCQQGRVLRYNEDDECYEVTSGHYIIFYPNGGEGGAKYQYVGPDGTATLEANTFTKENDEFHSWNTREGGGGEDYEDQQEVSLSGNLELYAQWENSGKIVAAVYDGDTLLNTYESLAGAIEAAEEGQTVKLLKDVTLSEGVTVPEGKDISLDLAGFDLSGSVSGPLLTNSGTLTIDGHGYYADGDDGSKKPSHVYNTDITSTDNLAVYNTGTLTINGGVYGDADDNDENANHVNRGSALSNYGGTATLNGGRFTACDGDWTESNEPPKYATYVISNDGGGILEINESMLHGDKIKAITNIINENDGQISKVLIYAERRQWDFSYGRYAAKEYYNNGLINNQGIINVNNLQLVTELADPEQIDSIFLNKGKNAELTINGGRFELADGVGLIENVGGMSMKCKIITGSIVGAGVAGVIGGIIAYIVSGKGAKPTDEGYDIEDGHNIIYHPNGGEGDDKIQFVESDDATLEKNTFTMEDGEFVDWCTEPDGDDGDHYSDGQKVHLEKGETLELYAQWTGYAVSVTHEGETKNYKRLGDALDETKSGDTVKLLRDIDLGDNWVPRGIKGITFDGNEKTVTYHIEDNADSYRGGLFSTVSGTTAISKLNINATIIAHGDDAVAGGLYAQEGENANVTVQDVSIEGHIDVSSCSGGVIGMHRSGSLALKNVKCNVDSMSTDGCAGGILGKGGEDLTALSFSSCSNECYVIGNVAGAICGDLAWHKNKTTETGWAVCTKPSFGYEDCSNSGKIEGTTRSGMVLCEQKADFPTDNTAYDPVLHNFAYLAHQLSYAYYNNFDLEGEHIAANKQVTFKKDKSPLAENDHFNDNTLVPESITIEWFASEDEVRESDYVCYIKLADNSYLAYSSLIGAEMTCLNANEGHTVVLLKDCEEDVNGFLGQKWNGDRSYYENWRKKTLVVTLDKNGHSYPYESFMCGDVAVFVVSGGIAEVRNGDEMVGTYGTLASAVAAAQGSGYTVVMLDNLRLHAGVDVSGTVELELNGKKISNADSLEGDYLLAVLHQGDLTINDSSEGGTGAISMSKAACAIKMTKRAAGVTADPPYTAALEVNGGTIEGYNYAIAGNGEDGRGNTVVSINGGTIRATAPQGTKDVAAIYQPQKGVLWLHGGVVSGLTGVEIRAGSMGIPEDSTVVIEGTGSPASVEANAGGATTIGAGVAIAQHTTEKPIDVTIAGGSISGAWALSVANPQEIEDGGADTSVQLAVSGGTFKGAGEGGKALSVTDERVHGFVTGGKFSEQVPWACCEENYGPVTVPDGEGWYTVELLPEDVHYAVNLTLRDGIAVNYYIKDVTPDEIHKYRVKYSYVNEDGQTVELEHQYSEEDLYNESDYRFKMLDLYSWQMGWGIKIKMYYGSVESNEYTYSVRQYLENQIARYGDDPEKAEFVDLCKAMLDYGAAAQGCFDGRTYIDEAGVTHHYRTDAEHLVNAKTNPENVVNADKPSEKYDVSVVGTIAGVEYYGSSLIFGADTSMRVFLTGNVDDTVAVSCLDSRGNFRACGPVTRSGDRYYFDVKGIKCYELDMMYTIEIIKDKEAITVVRSPYSNARSNWDSADATTRQLMRALVAYGDKASAWVY